MGTSSESAGSDTSGIRTVRTSTGVENGDSEKHMCRRRATVVVRQLTVGAVYKVATAARLTLRHAGRNRLGSYSSNRVQCRTPW